MNIAQLTNKELQDEIDLLATVDPSNTIARIIIGIFQRELDRRQNGSTNTETN